MNIFYLDPDPQLCAQYHADRHVVKMILESAQLLCTAVNVAAGGQVTPYKSTHVNHPCSVWVRENFGNWSYVYDLMIALEKEWQYRYGKAVKHKSVELLQNFNTLWPSFADYACAFLVTQESRTAPPLCIPGHCQISPDPVESYREYYRKEKVALHKWTGRDVPYWL